MKVSAKFNNHDISPEFILKEGGYNKMPFDKGWVRKIDKTYRYHAFITPENKIEIHTDKNKKRLDGSKFHIASTYLVREEKHRLKQILIPLLPEPPISRKTLKKQQTLPHELQVVAFAKLKEENEKRRLKIKWYQKLLKNFLSPITKER